MKVIREEVLRSPIDTGLYSLMMGGLCATINCTPDEIDLIDDGMSSSEGKYSDIDEFIDGDVKYSFTMGRRILEARNEFVPYFKTKQKEDGIYRRKLLSRELGEEKSSSTETKELECASTTKECEAGSETSCKEEGGISTSKGSVGGDTESATPRSDDDNTGYAGGRKLTEAEREAGRAHERAKACSPDTVRRTV